MQLTWFQQLLFLIAFLCALWLFYNTVKNMPMFTSFTATNGEGFRGGLMITDHQSNDVTIGNCTIKAAYNSAMTSGGKMVVGGPNEQKGLYEVIGKGCRFLDFAIFNDNEKPAIGYHTGGDFLNEESINDPMLPVYDVLNVIQTCAFTGPSPNPNDPLFLQFRMHTTNKIVFDKLHDAISEKFGDKLYDDDDTITSDTTINNLKNKLILVIVTSNANQDSTNPNINRIDLNKMCKESKFYEKAGESENRTPQKYVLHSHLTDKKKYSHIDTYDVKRTPSDTESRIFTVKMPLLNDPTNEHVNQKFEKSNKIQPMKFYVIDDPLVDYEEHFNNNGTAYDEQGS